MSIGTETIGSIMMPATRAALCAVKLTQVNAPMKGIIPISCALDTLGPIAKTTRYIADLLDIIVPPRPSLSSYTTELSGAWSKLHAGALDPKEWPWPNFLAKLDPEAQEQIVSPP